MLLYLKLAVCNNLVTPCTLYTNQIYYLHSRSLQSVGRVEIDHVTVIARASGRASARLRQV